MSGFLRNTANRCMSNVRSFSRNTVRFEKSPSTTTGVDAEVLATDKLSRKTHRVNNLEKRFLVWSGKFKNVDEVPALLAAATVEKARNKARIRIANCMMLVTAVACIAMAISGKRAAERGESLQKANLEWHRLVKEEDAKNAPAGK